MKLGYMDPHPKEATAVYFRQQGNKIYFTAFSTRFDAMDKSIDLWQKMCGYPAQGYGTSGSFNIFKRNDGLYEITWYCWASSD